MFKLSPITTLSGKSSQLFMTLCKKKLNCLCDVNSIGFINVRLLYLDVLLQCFKPGLLGSLVLRDASSRAPLEITYLLNNKGGTGDS